MYRHAFAKCVSFEARALKNRVTQQKRGGGFGVYSDGCYWGAGGGRCDVGPNGPFPPNPPVVGGAWLPAGPGTLSRRVFGPGGQKPSVRG